VASFALGPYPLTLGVTAAAPPPTSGPWGWVVLSNLSPYLLQVTAGTTQAWLSPWTESIFDASSVQTPVTMVPSLPAGAALLGSAQVEATWYDPTQKPLGVWPMSLTADALSALSTTPIDNLGEAGIITGTPGIGNGLGMAEVAALHNYAAIGVVLPREPLVAGIAQGFCVSVTNNGPAGSGRAQINTAYQYQRCDSNNSLNPQTSMLVFPLPANTGDVLQVGVVQTWGTTLVSALTFGVTVYGLGAPVTPANLRSDGRSLPQHSLVTAGTSAGPLTGALLAAPGAGLRYMVGGVTTSGGLGANGFAEITGTVEGTTYIIGGTIGLNAAVATSDRTYEQGLLLDQNTALNIDITAAISMLFSVDYDVVV
jgi:hypothetical protein